MTIVWCKTSEKYPWETAPKNRFEEVASFPFQEKAMRFIVFSDPSEVYLIIFS